MQVTVIQVAQDGTETRQGRDFLWNVLPDFEERARAFEEIKRSGRVWIGGGGAPLFLLIR